MSDGSANLNLFIIRQIILLRIESPKHSQKFININGLSKHGSFLFSFFRKFSSSRLW